jgi:hypothetical protein
MCIHHILETHYHSTAVIKTLMIHYDAEVREQTPNWYNTRTYNLLHNPTHVYSLTQVINIQAPVWPAYVHAHLHTLVDVHIVPRSKPVLVLWTLALFNYSFITNVCCTIIHVTMFKLYSLTLIHNQQQVPRAIFVKQLWYESVRMQ